MNETEQIRRRDKIRAKLRRLSEKDILKAMRDTLDEGYALFKRKLGDYGVDVYKDAGGIGIITRLKDKFGRFDNLMRKRTDPNFESIRDTVQDISVYATTLLAMIDKGLIDLEELQEQYIMNFPVERIVEDESDGE
jgi:hypothetical protein